MKKLFLLILINISLCISCFAYNEKVNFIFSRKDVPGEQAEVYLYTQTETRDIVDILTSDHGYSTFTAKGVLKLISYRKYQPALPLDFGELDFSSQEFDTANLGKSFILFIIEKHSDFTEKYILEYKRSDDGIIVRKCLAAVPL